jgi:hypothetical protein
MIGSLLLLRRGRGSCPALSFLLCLRTVADCSSNPQFFPACCRTALRACFVRLLPLVRCFAAEFVRACSEVHRLLGDIGVTPGKFGTLGEWLKVQYPRSSGVTACEPTLDGRPEA